MTKKKTAKAKVEDAIPKNQLDNELDVFVGGEEDDLMDMKYINDETTHDRVETHPPETIEEAEVLAAGKKIEDDAAKALEDGEKAAEDLKKEVKEKEDGKTPEPEAKTEEGKTEEKVVLEDDIKIPKERFDEVNTRMKTAEEDVKNLRKQLETKVEKAIEPEPDPFDYATKEQEAMDALLEGDNKKYAAIQGEIRAADRKETLREAKKLAEQGDTDLRDTLTFEEAGLRIEDEYPQLVEGSETANDVAREEMLDLYVGYARSGSYTKVQALQKAAAQAARLHDLKPTSAPADEVKPDNVVDIKKTDVAAKAKVANDQPPAMEARAPGQSEEAALDLNSMSDEEFDAMPESTKRRARGDFL